MTDGFETIAYASADGIAKITLDRPQKHNAFNEAMHADLRAALDRAQSDENVRAIVLSGAGKSFCAGQDLSDRRLEPGAKPRDLSLGLEKLYNPLIKRLRSMPIPLVAAVNGAAVGAGCGIALACDIVIAGRSAKFIQAFAKIGLTLDAGNSHFLPRRVGAARAFAMALLADAIDASRAEEWGLIWKCVEDDALQSEAAAIAGRLAAMSPASMRLIKQSLNASAGNGLDEQLALEATLQREAGFAGDYQEGVLAFLEKRAPDYSRSRDK
ncbi:MAG: enoyl-CoA hydratase-related protein [Alphaproteobacteria bacterium]